MRDIKVIFSYHSDYKRDFDNTPLMETDHYLSERYVLVKFPLSHAGEWRVYSQGLGKNYKSFNFLQNFPKTLQFISESLILLLYILKNLPNRKVVVIAGESLSACTALLVKIFFSLKVIFITFDFSERRFASPLLNWLYHKMDEYSTKNSDVNYCVSDTIIEYKKSTYKFSGNNLVRLPNTPPQWLVDRFKSLKKVPYRIVYVGVISSHVYFEELLTTVALLQKTIPNIHLVLVGGGPKEAELKDIIAHKGMSNVTMKGFQSYENSLIEVAKAEVGMALYNGTLNFNKYGDSAKIRDYQSLSTIPITTNIIRANSKEILKFQSGIVLENISELGSMLSKVFTDQVYKNTLIQGCVNNVEMWKDSHQHFISNFR